MAIGHFVLNQVSAYSASPAVVTGSPTNRFTPNIITINAGDTVTFNWSAGTHVVDLKDVSPDLSIDSTHTTGTTTAFTTAGTYYFYCSIHATDALATEAHVLANDAMVGKIVVSAGAAATATPTRAAPPPAATATAPPVIVPATPPPLPTVRPAAPAAPITGTSPTGGSDEGTVRFLALIGAAALFGVAAGGTILIKRRS